MFDDDNSGTISLEEMMMLISKIGGNLTEGEAVGLIRQHILAIKLMKVMCFLRQADTDNNGVIDKEEFRQLWGAVRCSGGGEVSVNVVMSDHQSSDAASSPWTNCQ